ncbi:MAG: polymer-forming cytoskeletal protein [Candidatus Marinimicrobia bacterium]|nr:polymer-forming cytoskeletal protein [Candidatus Neomarinimicrobiota bacterium]
MDKSAVDKVNTIIGEETQLTGNVKLKGSIVIYGKVDGNINTEATITVGKEGLVEGDLNGNNVTISGRVNGNIIAKTKMILKKNSRLIGDVKAQKIVIDDGAVFEGKCDMNLNESKNKVGKNSESEKASSKKKS